MSRNITFTSEKPFNDQSSVVKLTRNEHFAKCVHYFIYSSLPLVECLYFRTTLPYVQFK